MKTRIQPGKRKFSKWKRVLHQGTRIQYNFIALPIRYVVAIKWESPIVITILTVVAPVIQVGT